MAKKTPDKLRNRSIFQNRTYARLLAEAPPPPVMPPRFTGIGDSTVDVLTHANGTLLNNLTNAVEDYRKACESALRDYLLRLKGSENL